MLRWQWRPICLQTRRQVKTGTLLQIVINTFYLVPIVMISGTAVAKYLYNHVTISLKHPRNANNQIMFF